MDNVRKQRMKTKTYQSGGDPYGWINEYFNYTTHFISEKHVKSWCNCQNSINTTMSAMLQIDPMYLYLLDIETFFQHGIRESLTKNDSKEKYKYMTKWLTFGKIICKKYFTKNIDVFNYVKHQIDICELDIEVYEGRKDIDSNDLTFIFNKLGTIKIQNTDNLLLLHKLSVLQNNIGSTKCKIQQLLGYIIKCASNEQICKYSELFRYMYNYKYVITLLTLPSIHKMIIYDVIELEDDLPSNDIFKDSVVNIISLIGESPWKISSTFPTNNRHAYI